MKTRKRRTRRNISSSTQFNAKNVEASEFFFSSLLRAAENFRAEILSPRNYASHYFVHVISRKACAFQRYAMQRNGRFVVYDLIMKFHELDIQVVKEVTSRVSQSVGFCFSSVAI